MERNTRSSKRKRDSRDSSSMVLESVGICEKGAPKEVDESGEVKDDELKDTPGREEAGEEGSTELPPKRRSLFRSVKEISSGKENLEVKEKKTKKKGKTVKKASRKIRPKKSKASKKKVESEEDEGEFEVEKILKVKILRNGKKEFLIHWKGFSAEYDTWEPESNLDCKDLVNEYFEEHKEIINSSDEEDKKSNKTKAQEARSTRLTRSKATDSGVESKRNANEDTKTEGRSTKQSRSKGKQERSRERTTRSTSARTKKEESPRADLAEEADGKMEGTEEILENPKNSSEEKGESSGDADVEEGLEEYEVDRIIDLRHRRDGTREFLIKWRGFGKKYNTWEPESNLSCSEKLEKFLKGVEESMTERELRVERKRTTCFTAGNEIRGRKHSQRLGKMPRKSYTEVDYND